ncbi:MAG TPA: J domain-containing protein [Lysinibacillus sp.]|jgi:curved DNA-binding protein|uniref:J domain-containing protein n=1 Tax=Lysinibacillus fusiformis TaxID=28031 RepID=A0A2I0V0R9_9BACI|nr:MULTISPECIES: DnaJ domain-containing protein [Lysinibacillus]HBT71230.1 J domain-containing protein [Lysinibacillus sp.]KUF34075.1 molecular chaperone DnaJ [Lysinibacillus sp. F5]MEE3806000.1 DnaJ domain-containing protein [Lysinibacillus fusiformis]PKU51913.1 J domain-containing protein [Lysinibacillus fusiformis]WCH46244.1 DnaJ domain-containing protein [Lysinibacillus sp. OF-1]
MKTHYETLGIDRNATQEQIKLAYRKLSKKHHPDVSGGNQESEKIFLEVQEAYKVLKDPALKETYDARLDGKGTSWQNEQQNEKHSNGHQSTEKKPDFNMNNIEKNFEHFFGFNPKTKEMSSTLHKKTKKNPLDTTDLFERFFNK